MASKKKKNGSRRRGIRVAATIGIIAGVWKSIEVIRGSSNWANDLVVSWTGYNPDSGDFNIKNANALLPVAAGCAVSLVASKVGLNRYTPPRINI